MARRSRELTPDRSARHLFGSEIRRHRELAGMSLERLAEVVRYSRSHLSRIEVAEHHAAAGSGRSAGRGVRHGRALRAALLAGTA
ncbi:helix-turn-helix transcriptional regulator [Streptomyces syringium]|uniref:helix-turn-helix domain-containing protein n=1 Tax=Streptomyces syringium TaxID=76729 RepID=UPI0033FDF82D